MKFIIIVSGLCAVFPFWNFIFSGAINYHEQFQLFLFTGDYFFSRVSVLNLALCEKGVIGNRLFEFYQNGGQGLIPKFERDFTTPLSTAEIFLRLGMVNTCQRYIFEAQEAIPNYRKSGRMIKRLAETNIINGDYEVARKYLELLQNSLFYKSFADDALTYLNNEDKINNHKFWGEIRKIRYTDDFLFSEAEPDQMFGLLLMKNASNRMACDYLISYVLLEKDLQKFLNYYRLCGEAGYKILPLYYQQALIFGYFNSHNNSLSGMTDLVSQSVVNQFKNFVNIYSRNLQSIKSSDLKNSYYAYLLNLK